jgi:hypothetical protein
VLVGGNYLDRVTTTILTVDRNPEFNYISDGYHPAARVPVVTSNAPRGLSELGGPALAC